MHFTTISNAFFNVFIFGLVTPTQLRVPDPSCACAVGTIKRANTWWVAILTGVIKEYTTRNREREELARQALFLFM